MTRRKSQRVRLFRGTLTVRTALYCVLLALLPAAVLAVDSDFDGLSDDEEHTVETRDFQLFTNAVVERSGEFWKYIPGVISRDNALFCVGMASDEPYHAQLREHFQKPENLGIEPEKVGVAPNEDEAERRDFEEELQQTGRRRGDVIWAKDIEPVTELRVVSADTQSVYLLVGIAAVAAFLITAT